MKKMSRLLTAAIAGIVGSALSQSPAMAMGKKGDDSSSTKMEKKAASAKHSCAGQNECKGMGGCKTAKHDCAGKNDCKGQGGCKGEMHKGKGMNECKGQGGCKT